MRIIRINENNAHYWHMRLWNWLANNPKKIKEDWPGWKYVEKTYQDCFACKIANERHVIITGFHNPGRRCFYCPIEDWTHKLFSCEHGEYFYWKYYTGKEKQKYAKIIANMKWGYLC